MKGQRIHTAGEVADITVVKSSLIDHGYLQVSLQLQDEKTPSIWEMDAWDPRIIDISPRPDGSIKNREMLDYGYPAVVHESVSSDALDYRIQFLFTDTPKPEEGQAEGRCTPISEMLSKHAALYSDHTLDKALAPVKKSHLREPCITCKKYRCGRKQRLRKCLRTMNPSAKKDGSI
ncbi:hypothetical protein GH742_10140 [Legionella sp. MW5194]|uniref:hypothetical protein n=1 Tax=Legionella sp. MW5194 TaxID=2662448 RepID=UPI00193D72FA|nr:hypothetical protein [Legionella sp. MW5194]QRN04204.1 hypothetical protein GH742_10140 [Legionella sp. MW5194]